LGAPIQMSLPLGETLTWVMVVVFVSTEG